MPKSVTYVLGIGWNPFPKEGTQPAGVIYGEEYGQMKLDEVTGGSRYGASTITGGRRDVPAVR